MKAPIYITKLTVPDACEIARAIYTGDMETLNGWADWMCDEVAEAVTAAGEDIAYWTNRIISDDGSNEA